MKIRGKFIGKRPAGTAATLPYNVYNRRANSAINKPSTMAGKIVVVPPKKVD